MNIIYNFSLVRKIYLVDEFCKKKQKNFLKQFRETLLQILILQIFLSIFFITMANLSVQNLYQIHLIQKKYSKN